MYIITAGKKYMKKISPVLDFFKNWIYNSIHNSTGCFVFELSSNTFVLILWLRRKETLNIVGLTPLIFRLQPLLTMISMALLRSAPNFAVDETITLEAITAQRKSGARTQVTLAWEELSLRCNEVSLLRVMDSNSENAFTWSSFWSRHPE